MNKSATSGKEVRKTVLARLLTPFTELFGLSRGASLAAFLLVTVVVAFAFYWFFHSAPPRTLIITAGPPGSIFQTNAEKYLKILATNGVKLKIRPSQGSLENLKRLGDPSIRVDIGFVQSGITNADLKEKLVSLGSIYNQPLMVFYRSAAPLTLLSDFKGKRLAIGPDGSGTRSLALTLLKLNEIEPGGATTLSDLDSGDAAKALLDGKLDAVFLMGDSASPQIMSELLHTPGIRIFNFTQADGYTRRIGYLNKLELPMGSIDFGKNIPDHDLYLIGPAVEILARPNLHPALSDLLLEAATQVHGEAGLLRRKKEFPAALAHDFPLSADAARFYNSGKSFFYKHLPFWLASLANRILVVFVPVAVVLIPGVRIIPTIYRWRIKLLIYRRYRALLALERDLIGELTTPQRERLLARLDQIEEAVGKMKVPASFADQFYGLRADIDFVRSRIEEGAAEASGNRPKDKP